MIKSVLFDLDGTLLPFDQDEFVQAYFRSLGAHVAPYINPQKFIQQLLRSTGVMVGNRDATKTNQQIFYEDFLPNIGVPQETLLPVIDAFYEHHFANLRTVAKPSDAAREAVLTAIQENCDVVVATNPIFPANAVRQRLEWSGVGDLPFTLITSYEYCHFCKPNPEYFLEIAGMIGRRPEECLMIGNDIEEDLVAATVGMKTFLVTDCLINAKGLEVQADYAGTLADLAHMLPGILKK